MKKNAKIRQKDSGNGCKPWRIEFSDPAARSVSIAGSFNGWRPEATPMISLGNGHWFKELSLSPGRYEYLIVADGKWLPDPAVKETASNPFGGMNSVVTVKEPARQEARPAELQAA